MTKHKHFFTADNTTIDFPAVDYKYNWDTYKIAKVWFWILSIGGFILSLGAVLLSSNGVIQTIAGAFMGGILSLIVWLFTIRHQDKMNHEIANIDMHIMKIDELLELQCSKTQFIKPEEEELIDYDDEDVGKKFLLLLTVLNHIISDKDMDKSSLRLKFLNEEELTIESFVEKSKAILVKGEFRVIASDNEWSKLIAWNNWYIDWKLKDLKKKLERYKTYILCGNAPSNYSMFKKNRI